MGTNTNNNTTITTKNYTIIIARARSFRVCCVGETKRRTRNEIVKKGLESIGCNECRGVRLYVSRIATHSKPKFHNCDECNSSQPNSGYSCAINNFMDTWAHNSHAKSKHTAIHNWNLHLNFISIVWPTHQSRAMRRGMTCRPDCSTSNNYSIFTFWHELRVSRLSTNSSPIQTFLWLLSRVHAFIFIKKYKLLLLSTSPRCQTSEVFSPHLSVLLSRFRGARYIFTGNAFRGEMSRKDVNRVTNHNNM